ncbi:MAG: M48 family metalloprotease [bacterium]
MSMYEKIPKVCIRFAASCIVSGIFLLTVCQGSVRASTQKTPPEVDLGRKVYAQIRPHLSFTKNPLIRHELEGIGKRIVGNLPVNPYEFTFFPIISGDVNAFALPNGYIFVTNRLIQTCDTADELAFVLCHETAHVMRGHFMNFISQQAKVDLSTLALIVLGALIARDSDLQAGIPALSLGLNQNLALSYSRIQEYEADSYGLRYLAQSGFNSEGAPRFMEKLRVLSQITISPPVYLSTHPMPVDRLINIKKRAEACPSCPSRSMERFSRLKLWCRVETELADRLLAEFTPLSMDNPNDVDVIYSLALIHEKLGSSKDAEGYYKKGLTLSPRDEDLLRDYAIFLYRRDRIEDAESFLKQAVAIKPDDPLAQHYLGRTLMDHQRIDEAIEAFLESVRICPEFPESHNFLGILYNKKGDEEKSHHHFARYFSLLGNEEAAQAHSKKTVSPSTDEGG